MNSISKLFAVAIALLTLGAAAPVLAQEAPKAAAEPIALAPFPADAHVSQVTHVAEAMQYRRALKAA